SSVTVVIGLTNSSVIGNYWNSTQIQINQGNFSRWINNTFNVSTGSHAVDVNLETYLNFTGNNIYSRVLTGAALLISSHNSSFWNNTIYGSANDSILLSSFVNATQNVFFNNTINSSSEYAVRVTNGTNNIFYRNHFLGSKGINATVGNTSFCENGIGNLYNESITPALMGSGDCGQANITDTLNGATLSGIVVVNWTAQSSFQNVTYNLYLDNGSTLLVSTQELNFSWDTAGSPDGAHQLYLVPNITSFGLRFNATTNLSEQFTLSNAGAAPPNVSYPLPFPNSSFRNGTKVEISANITDDGRLDRIYANITYPSGVTVNITMFNSTTAFNNTNPPNNFSVLFNDTSVTGLYNVSFFANDTDGNVNNTIKTNFSLQDPCGCLLDNGGTETGTCRVENGFCTSSVNITVNPNANLTLINTTLRMETSTEGAIGIRALQPSEPGTRGGYLNISHSSNITNASAAYSFIIEQNTNFSMTDSVVSGVGWSHDTDRRGLEISSKVTQFRNNTIQKGFYGLVLRSNNNTIENTTVKEYSDHGAGGSAGILLNISHNTTLRNVVVLNWFSSLDLIGGINLFESHNNSIKDSILINSGSDDGILISNSNSTLVNNTKIINASGNGIFVRQSTNTNITNNTITQTSDTTGFSAISMPSGSSRPVSTRIIGNAIYNISSTVGAQINCGDCIISENIFFNNSETPGLILLNFPGIGNITNNTIKHNNVPIGILVDDFPQNERIRMVENNSIINNSFSRRAIEITGNFTTVRNNTLINNTGIGIYTAGSPVGSRSLRNITIRENLVRNHGNDSAEHWPIYIGISNVTMERNIIFENRAVRDLYIDTVSKVNATLNHFLSKGVNGTDLVNSSFCNLVDSLLKGNFYNESITPTFIGTGDCGLANITDTIDRGIFKGNITVNWTNQSSFKEIMTYSIFEGNGTLFGTTTLNNLTINTSQMHDGFHILRIVPNITEFDLRINATVNLSENFTVDNFPPDIRVNEWGGDTAYPYETTNRTPELNGTIIEDFGNCRTSRTNESFDNMANDINCTGGNPDPGISCIVPTDLAPGFYTYFVACNSTLGNKDGPDGTNQNFTIEIVGNTECILNPSFAGVSFGEMGQDAGGLEESNTTEDDRPRPLLLFNNGTVLFNVTLNATNLWNVSPNPSNNFLYRIEDNETNSFYGAETTDWVQMQRARDSATTAVDRLRYVNGTNTANTIELELNITVPVEEDPGDKDSSIDV
ncbi:right-handed parallel beta-helix repeat-containing protein, partial [Candidatus Woesearchaeota archaeon]|nr:right-handed parallel beta-helix repeat-containing protein [Candidatus Woesearchaeota archaeon]